MAQHGLSVQHGFFLDPGRFRRMIGKEVFESLRYYETAAEVVADCKDPDKPPKAVHRCVLLAETVLFVLDVAKKEASRDVWAGECAHPPIMLKDVISIQPMAKRSEIFAEDEINKTVRHFELVSLVTDRKGARTRNRIELAAWETGSLLLNQVTSAWINLSTRLCLQLDISVSLDQDGDKSMLFELYREIAEDIMRAPPSEIEAVIASLDELANSALHDREMKKHFFTLPALSQFLLKELDALRLPAGFEHAPRPTDARAGALTERCAERAAPSHEQAKAHALSRTDQLRLARSILQVFHSMTFNSQTVISRSALLQPAPLSFTSLLEIICQQLDPQAVQRGLRRLQAAACQERKEGDSDSDEDGGEDEEDEEDGFETLDKTRAAAEDESAGLLRSINELQVALLVELEDVVCLAVRQGRSRDIVSETLANQLSKTGPDFARFALPKYVRHLVVLIEQWQAGLQRGWGAVAVRIYQHAKLLHNIVMGSYKMLGHVLDNCEEELRYYLFKDAFISALRETPHKARGFQQIAVLNRLSIEMLVEVRDAVRRLQTERTKHIRSKSVLLV